MIECNGYSSSDSIRNISIFQPPLDKYNNSQIIDVDKKYLKFKDKVYEERQEEEAVKVKSLRSVISCCNVSRIDVTLNNMHKRWSLID
ncbi:MAG TPA: hypothetical protein VD815_02035 [Candidatus Saccharimonadales bacterium]|nr:hypothetical protein [Candidatus Saccharimonadales bacterium]